MIAQEKKNAEAKFPFNSLSFWHYDSKANQLTNQYSTARDLAGKVQAAGDEMKLTKPVFRDGANDSLEFLAPVILGGMNKGYVQAVYDNAIILRPYYQTQFKVFMIAGIFLYLAIFVTYLFGRNIVIPILFLRMSVNSISQMLSQMIQGSRRINTGDLMYHDRVTSRDEIKSLSMEIGNMATVIRGVIPYISASTLKNAERDVPTTEKRDLCFLFTDIRGFTTLCEGHEPAEVVEMLNHYLELQSSVILANHGDIDKFVGDEIMAMFEGPEKELNACRAGIGIRLGMAREKELAEAAKKKAVAIGIGINTGPVVFGSVGAQDRMDFTSIGDTVNLAARLEGANKEYGTKTLVTEAVWNKVKDEFLCREIDYMTVKGKSLPVRVYEVIREKADAPAKLVHLASSFEKGLAAYRSQDWAGAEQVFLELIKEYDDETSKMFLDRVNMFRKNPPAKDWDGVFNLTVK
jgi:class 3 adenylate cyclase